MRPRTNCIAVCCLTVDGQAKLTLKKSMREIKEMSAEYQKKKELMKAPRGYMSFSNGVKTAIKKWRKAKK